jgi:hypothetical protein
MRDEVANQHDINTLAGFDTEFDKYVQVGSDQAAGSSKTAATGRLPPIGSGRGTDMEQS